MARTTEVGSRTLVAGVAVGMESHGGYMVDGRIGEYVPPVFILYFIFSFVITADGRLGVIMVED